MRGRPKAQLVLTESEREQLQAWSQRRKTAQALALRSRIVLGCASGQPNQAVAQQLLQALATMGHHGQRVDLSIHGTCAVCVEPEDKATA